LFVFDVSNDDPVVELWRKKWIQTIVISKVKWKSSMRPEESSFCGKGGKTEEVPK
jgi:hypothetical protein